MHNQLIPMLQLLFRGKTLYLLLFCLRLEIPDTFGVPDLVLAGRDAGQNDANPGHPEKLGISEYHPFRAWSATAQFERHIHIKVTHYTALHTVQSLTSSEYDWWKAMKWDTTSQIGYYAHDFICKPKVDSILNSGYGQNHHIISHNWNSGKRQKAAKNSYFIIKLTVNLDGDLCLGISPIGIHLSSANVFALIVFADVENHKTLIGYNPVATFRSRCIQPPEKNINLLQKARDLYPLWAWQHEWIERYSSWHSLHDSLTPNPQNLGS